MAFEGKRAIGGDDIDLIVPVDIRAFDHLVGAILQLPDPQGHVLQSLGGIENDYLQSDIRCLSDQRSHSSGSPLPTDGISWIDAMTKMRDPAQTRPLSRSLRQPNSIGRWLTLGVEYQVLHQVLDQRC